MNTTEIMINVKSIYNVTTCRVYEEKKVMNSKEPATNQTANTDLRWRTPENKGYCVHPSGRASETKRKWLTSKRDLIQKQSNSRTNRLRK